MENKDIIEKIDGAIEWVEQRTPFTVYQKELVRMQFIHTIRQLIIADVSQQRELLIAFDTMREFDIKHDDIEESVDYFLKNKESYL
mgnify:CR=1 FL=1